MMEFKTHKYKSILDDLHSKILDFGHVPRDITYYINISYINGRLITDYGFTVSKELEHKEIDIEQTIISYLKILKKTIREDINKLNRITEVKKVTYDPDKEVFYFRLKDDVKSELLEYIIHGTISNDIKENKCSCENVKKVCYYDEPDRVNVFHPILGTFLGVYDRDEGKIVSYEYDPDYGDITTLDL